MHQRPPVLSWSFVNFIAGFVLAGAAISVQLQESPGGCGDYPQNFVVLYQCMGIGAAVGMLLYAFYDKLRFSFLLPSFTLTFIRYFLAVILMGYGASKVFTSQFPHLMANMDARLVELTPMRVAWAFFGYSRSYQIFLGWAEVIPAVLLLFRRTTLLGALLLFTVLFNVFLLNIFFDVCVKLNSGLYAVLSLYIMLQDAPRLWNFFFTDKGVLPREPLSLTEQPKWLKITAATIRYGALAYACWLMWLDISGTYTYAHNLTAKSNLQGAWKALDVQRWRDEQWAPVSADDSLYAGRIFFDGNGGVVQSQWVRDRFRFSPDSTQHHLDVTFTNNRNEWNAPHLHWQVASTHPDSLEVWFRWKADSLHARLILRKEKLTLYEGK
jgi:hypothetical protein